LDFNLWITGWYTTRDTLWACLALGEISSSMKSVSNGSLVVKLNGKEIKVVEFTPQDIYLKIYSLRNIYMDQFQPGKNELEVLLNCDKGNGHAVLELKKWWRSTPISAMPIEIQQNVESKKETVQISYVLIRNETSPLEAVMLEQRIPSGFELVENQLEQLKILPGVDHVELNLDKGILGIFYSSLRSITNFTVDFIPTVRGKIQIEGTTYLF
jgi:hypothetical protein